MINFSIQFVSTFVTVVKAAGRHGVRISMGGGGTYFETYGVKSARYNPGMVIIVILTTLFYFLRGRRLDK